MSNIIPITAGDLFAVYGTVGYIDYSFRRRLKLDAPIDPDILAAALEKTARRYPYFCVRLRFGPEGYYYEPNDAPVALIRGSAPIRLASAQTNGHVWAVCYEGDELYIDFFHGLADGIGVGTLTETLLYYYCAARYGDALPDGVRTLEVPVSPAESADPLEELPEVPLPDADAARPPVYDLVADGGLTPCPTVVTDVIVPEKPFLRFTSASDASPGTMVSLLTAKAVEAALPARPGKTVIGHYVMNARPALRAPEGFHNCLSVINLTHSEKLRAMPFQTQCTAYRGMTFLQSDADLVRPVLEASTSAVRAIARIPDLSARREAYRRLLDVARTNNTFAVSYTGQWRRPSLALHVREFWTHAPGALPFVIEIKSASGNLFLSILRSTAEDTVERAFLDQLTAHDISYAVARVGANDIAAVPGPEALG